MLIFEKQHLNNKKISLLSENSFPNLLLIFDMIYFLVLLVLALFSMWHVFTNPEIFSSLNERDAKSMPVLLMFFIPAIFLYLQNISLDLIKQKLFNKKNLLIKLSFFELKFLTRDKSDFFLQKKLFNKDKKEIIELIKKNECKYDLLANQIKNVDQNILTEQYIKMLHQDEITDEDLIIFQILILQFPSCFEHQIRKTIKHKKKKKNLA